jgi:hypothetical protein
VLFCFSALSLPINRVIMDAIKPKLDWAWNIDLFFGRTRMQEEIPPTPEALEEALELSSDILKDIELSRVPLPSAALKASRLARLLNHVEAQSVFHYEASGYPSTPTGVTPKVWSLLQMANRTYEENVPNSQGKTRTVAFLESIEHLEHELEACKLGLDAARDRDVSVSSANPEQFVMAPMGNWYERQGLHSRLLTASQRLASRRSLIYQYAARRHYELKFSGVAQNVFAAVRESVDRKIGAVIPDAIQRFASVYENLRSTNPEDWSNAVHSCRRILQSFADAVFPPSSEDRVTDSGKRIKLGQDNYINRLVCFAEDKSGSERFSEMVGSHLGFLGDRLDAVFAATQKGSHATVGRDEANRYVVYTYMLIGDILSLCELVNDI